MKQGIRHTFIVGLAALALAAGGLVLPSVADAHGGGHGGGGHGGHMAGGHMGGGHRGYAGGGGRGYGGYYGGGYCGPVQIAAGLCGPY